jgi:hypothetical protein
VTDEAVRDYLSKLGERGAATKNQNVPEPQRKRVANKAAQARWATQKQELALPRLRGPVRARLASLAESHPMKIKLLAFLFFCVFLVPGFAAAQTFLGGCIPVAAYFKTPFNPYAEQEDFGLALKNAMAAAYATTLYGNACVDARGIAPSGGWYGTNPSTSSLYANTNPWSGFKAGQAIDIYMPDGPVVISTQWSTPSSAFNWWGFANSSGGTELVLCNTAGGCGPNQYPQFMPAGQVASTCMGTSGTCSQAPNTLQVAMADPTDCPFVANQFVQLNNLYTDTFLNGVNLQVLSGCSGGSFTAAGATHAAYTTTTEYTTHAIHSLCPVSSSTFNGNCGADLSSGPSANATCANGSVNCSAISSPVIPMGSPSPLEMALALPSSYSSGTISVNNTTNVVTGSGTTWLPTWVGGWFISNCPATPCSDYGTGSIGTYTAQKIIGIGATSSACPGASATSLCLQENWTGGTLSGASYVIIPANVPVAVADAMEGPSVNNDSFGHMWRDVAIDCNGVLGCVGYLADLVQEDSGYEDFQIYGQNTQQNISASMGACAIWGDGVLLVRGHFTINGPVLCSMQANPGDTGYSGGSGPFPQYTYGWVVDSYRGSTQNYDEGPSYANLGTVEGHSSTNQFHDCVWLATNDTFFVGPHCEEFDHDEINVQARSTQNEFHSTNNQNATGQTVIEFQTNASQNSAYNTSAGQSNCIIKDDNLTTACVTTAASSVPQYLQSGAGSISSLMTGTMEMIGSSDLFTLSELTGNIGQFSGPVSAQNLTVGPINPTVSIPSSSLVASSGANLSTTISGTASTTTMINVTSVIDFAVDQGVCIVGAGGTATQHCPGSTSNDCVSEITAVVTTGTPKYLTISPACTSAPTTAGKGVYHDDGAALQAAINVNTASNAQPVILPQGVFNVNTACQTTNTVSGMLLVPTINTSTFVDTPFAVVDIEGIASSLNLDNTAAQGGTVLQTASTGCAMIAGAGSSTFTAVNLVVNHLDFRLPLNPANDAVNAFRIGRLSIPDFIICDVGSVPSAIPTAGGVCVQTPEIFNPDFININSITAYGFTAALSIYEHTVVNHLLCGYDKFCLMTNEVTGGGLSHGNTIQHMNYEYTPYGVDAMGSSGYNQTPLTIQHMDAEHDSGTFAIVDDIYDPNNLLIGNYNWSATSGGGGTTLTTSGAADFFGTNILTNVSNVGAVSSSGLIAAALGFADKSMGVLTSAMAAQSSSSCTPITNMNWTTSNSKNYLLSCSLPITFVSGATVAFCVTTGTGSPTGYTLDAYGALGASAAFADINTQIACSGSCTSWGTKTSTAGSPSSAGSVTEIVHVVGEIRNSSGSGGTLQLETAANGTNNITVLADSVCRLTQED